MLLRILLFTLMATGLAGFGAVAWISTHPPPPVSIVAGVAVPAAVNVYLLAAAHTLRPGVLLKPEDLTTATSDQSAVPPGARIDTPTARAELLGAMLRHTIIAGEVLLPMHVMRAGERGFLAAVLGPGMRATTVGVDAVTGTAGLIWPGDHVDLILTETLDDPGRPLSRRIAGETVLHNVRVIAIDQELMQGAVGATAPTNGAAQSRTVTLEVSPDNAERVAVATRLGHLSLSVISADMPDEPTKATPTAIQAAAHEAVTWGGDVSAALLSGRKADPSSGSMHVYEGGAEAKELHF
jgi:pilus assembly protein CpaB